MFISISGSVWEVGERGESYGAGRDSSTGVPVGVKSARENRVDLATQAAIFICKGLGGGDLSEAMLYFQSQGADAMFSREWWMRFRVQLDYPEGENFTLGFHINCVNMREIFFPLFQKVFHLVLR